MCSLHYDFVWISDGPNNNVRWLGHYSFNYVWKLCNQRITRLLYGIYSDKKYKKLDDTIIMIM